MPIFEYACRACGHRFEMIVQSSTVPACPDCKSEQLEKQLSVFAVGSQGAGRAEPMPGPCGSCDVPGGPAACGMKPHD